VLKHHVEHYKSNVPEFHDRIINFDMSNIKITQFI